MHNDTVGQDRGGFTEWTGRSGKDRFVFWIKILCSYIMDPFLSGDQVKIGKGREHLILSGATI